MKASAVHGLCALGVLVVLELATLASASESHHTHPQLVLSPDATRMILNIGCHEDPPVPPDASTIVVAVEPLPAVAANIPKVPNRFILTAAVSNHSGISLFHNYKDSSSFALPKAQPRTVSAKGEHGAILMVPTVSLRLLLNALSNYECWFLKTDMQGFDFQAIAGAGAELKRCPYVLSETYCSGYEGYVGAQNDFQKQWLPHMTALGYEPFGGVDSCTKRGNAQVETNQVWKLKDTNVAPPTREQCPKCYT